MEKWTNQTAFTTAAKGMLKQMRRSKGRRGKVGGCMYRGKDEEGNTLCCGVGFLLSDELAEVMDTQYRSFDLRGTAITEWLSAEHEELKYIFSEVDRHLLGDLQNLHDGRDPDSWEEDLMDLAEEYDLGWEL